MSQRGRSGGMDRKRQLVQERFFALVDRNARRGIAPDYDEIYQQTVEEVDALIALEANCKPQEKPGAE